MKKLIITVSILLSQWSFAGTGGGGVMMISPEKMPQIVYHMGEQDGVVSFAYGKLVNGNWNVQKVEMPEADLLKYNSVTEALEASKIISEWVQVISN